MVILAEAYNAYKAFLRLLASFCIKPNSGVLGILDFDDILYSLYRNTSLS